MKKHKNRKSTRLTNWEYSDNGYYFVTICSFERECIFGDVVNGKMIENKIGKIVNHWWNELPKRFENVSLDEHQLMPNHFHGIVVINDTGTGRDNHTGRGNRAPTTLGKIIAYFKYQSTKRINQWYVGAGIIPPEMITKIWQRNYHDRIIRNEKELQKTRHYIYINPLKWDIDRNNPMNMKFVGV